MVALAPGSTESAGKGRGVGGVVLADDACSEAHDNAGAIKSVGSRFFERPDTASAFMNAS